MVDEKSIENAIKELKSKPMEEIERMTAETWASRAVASYRMSLETSAESDRFRHFYQGENYRQEALEHASMTEDGGELVKELHDDINDERQKAKKVLRSPPVAA